MAEERVSRMPGGAGSGDTHVTGNPSEKKKVEIPRAPLYDLKWESSSEEGAKEVNIPKSPM